MFNTQDTQSLADSASNIFADSLTEMSAMFLNLTGMSEVRDDGFLTSFHEPQECLSEFMTNFTMIWADQLETMENERLVGKNEDYTLPEWLDGDFLISGPSKFSMGNMKVNSALDGFGRFNRINFKDGEITLNSKMMNSTWYKMCEKAGKILPGMTFVPTSPVNWESKIPFVSLY